MSGHVFVTRGDLTRLACDAWLLPGNVDAGPEQPGVAAKWLTGAPELRDHFAGETLRDPSRAPGMRRVWSLPATDPDAPSVHLVHTGGYSGRDVAWYMEAL